jgi:hypothetical protein
VDLIILDILGSESPMIEGLAVPEPSGSNLVQPISIVISESPQSVATVLLLEPQVLTPPSNSAKQKKRANPSLDDEETILRKKTH